MPRGHSGHEETCVCLNMSEPRQPHVVASWAHVLLMGFRALLIFGGLILLAAMEVAWVWTRRFEVTENCGVERATGLMFSRNSAVDSLDMFRCWLWLKLDYCLEPAAWTVTRHPEHLCESTMATSMMKAYEAACSSGRPWKEVTGWTSQI